MNTPSNMVAEQLLGLFDTQINDELEFYKTKFEGKRVIVTNRLTGKREGALAISAVFIGRHGTSDAVMLNLTGSDGSSYSKTIKAESLNFRLQGGSPTLHYELI